MKKFAALISSFWFIFLAVGVSAAFAAFTFTGTNITGDTASTLDATGTVSIGASQATGITIGKSGITVTFPGAVTISGTTTTLQNLVISGNCTGTGCLVPGGDLSGNGSSQTVIGLQGRSVSSTAPSANQVLTWNGTSWAPANTGSGITAINGLGNATTSIVGSGGITVTTSSPNTITISGSGGSITINNMATTTFQIQGTTNQITVTTSSPNVIALSLPQNIATGSSPSFANLALSGNATTTNLSITGLAGASGCLSVSTTGAVTTSTCSGGGGGITAINGLSNSTTSIVGTGGITVTTSSPNVITVTFTDPGFVTAASSVTWTAAQTFNAAATFNATATFLGAIIASSTGAGSIQLAEGACPAAVSGSDVLCADSTLHAIKFSLNGGSLVAIPQLAGDLGNTAATPKVTGLQGVSVSSTAPSSNQCLVYNGTAWAPGSCGGGSLSGGQTNFIPIWTSASALGTSTLQATASALVTTGGFAVGTTTDQPAGNLFVTGNATTSKLTITSLAGASGCLSVSATGAVATSTCSGGSLSGGQANYLAIWTGSNSLGTSTLVASSTSIGTTGGFAIGTTTNQGTGNLLVTGNATTTNLSITGLAGASGCLSVSTTGAVTTSTCSGGGGGSGTVTTSSAISTNNFPFWASTGGGLSGTSTLTISGNTITNSGNAQIAGTLNVTSTATLQATTTILGNVALGTSTLPAGVNLYANYGSGTSTVMIGSTSTSRVGCLELVGDGGSTVYYLTISSAGALQISSSTCL